MQFWPRKKLPKLLINCSYFNIKKVCTGGPCISWFLVPKSNHEIWGSWIPRTVFSIKTQNGSKKILMSTFWAFFHEILFFSLFKYHFQVYIKVIHTKYSKHWPYTVAHTIDCVCRKILNHGLNHGLLFSLFKFFGWKNINLKIQD